MATYKEVLKKIEEEAYSSGGKSSTYDSELARANSVIAARKAAGQDTSAQTKYLNELKTSYNTGAVKGQAYSAGANPNNVDPGYVNAVTTGTSGAYLNNAVNNAAKTTKAATVKAPVYEAPDFTQQVKDIYTPMISSNLATLKAAYDKARSDVSAQIPTVQQDARTARTANESDYYTQSLPELYRAMEAAGQKGGQNITGQIAANTTRGSNLGEINVTELNNLAALQKAIADLNAEQPLKEQSVQQQLESEQAQALMNAQQYGLDYALRMADLTGNVETSPGVTTPTLAAQQYLTNKALNEASVTGTYEGQQTLASQQQNLDNLYRQQVFNYNTSRDAVADTQWQQTMGLNLRQQSFAEAQQKIENALAQKRISQEDASQALQWAKYNAEQDENSLDNQIKKAQLEGVGLSNTQTGLENANLSSGLTASGGTPSGGTTATEQKYAEEVKLAAVLDSKPTVEEKVAWIQANKANIIATFGKSYYDNLLANPY